MALFSDVRLARRQARRVVWACPCGRREPCKPGDRGSARPDGSGGYLIVWAGACRTCGGDLTLLTAACLCGCDGTVKDCSHETKPSL